MAGLPPCQAGNQKDPMSDLSSTKGGGREADRTPAASAWCSFKDHETGGFLCKVCAQSYLTLHDPSDHQAPLSMGLSTNNTGVGCYSLLQGIFLTQGLNPRLLCLLHWQAHSLSSGPPGNPIYYFSVSAKVSFGSLSISMSLLPAASLSRTPEA